MTPVSFQLQKAGYCTAHEWIALKGGSRKELVFPATYGLIHHPREGWMLFDTGYSRRFYAETATFPNKIYAWMTPVTVKEEEEAVAQVQRQGIDPGEIRHILISHFHGDHVGGLKDFPQAKMVCSQAAYEEAISLKGFQAVKKGVLPGLLPADLSERLMLIESSPFPKLIDPDLGEMVDLFGDASILIPMLPGHARGQIGALLNTDQGKVFLVADSCWLKQTYETGHLPSSMVKLFFDSWTEYKESLSRLRAYIVRNPETIIIPCHCEETRKRLMQET